MITLGDIDVLIICSEGNINNILSIANFIYGYCSRFKVDLYIEHNNQLLANKSVDEFKIE